MDGVRFYTRTKIVTQRWPRGGATERDFNMPMMK
jgi:malonate-semialdehyde dehydrogenase (acetylating)/methylmalonate-semialdehyde dehydrogenase